MAGAGRRFFRARVTALLLALLVALAWAHAVLRDRRERVTWERTLEVAVVLLARDPADPGLAVLRAGLGGLSGRLAEEMARHRGPGAPPFAFAVRGPVAFSRDLPLSPSGDGAFPRALHALTLWRTLREIEAAAGPAGGPSDARLYVLLEPAAGPGLRSFAEGAGAMGGEVGLVRTGVDGADATLALTAIGHELLHCLGATDKYDASGHALAPAGLVEPGLSPPLPQRLAEWMVGEVPLGPGRGRLPASLAEVAVGEATAREIGWLPPEARR